MKTGSKCAGQRESEEDLWCKESWWERAAGASGTTLRTFQFWSQSKRSPAGGLFVTNAPHQFKVVLSVETVLV